MRDVIVSLPDPIYERLEQRSQMTERSVGEAIREIITVSWYNEEKLPLEIERALEQLDYFTDDELWNAARTVVPEAKAARMEELLDIQDLEGLTAQEMKEAQQLSTFFNRVMLVRAKAAALLKERGHDINTLYRYHAYWSCNSHRSRVESSNTH